MLKSISIFRKWRNGAAFLFFLAFLCTPGLALAAASSASVRITQPSILSDCAQAVRNSIVPVNTVVTTVDALLQQSFFPLEKGMIALSPVCEFSFPDAGAPQARPKVVTLTFSHAYTPYRPRIYEWSVSVNKWRALPTVMDRTIRTVSVDLEKNSVILAVFADGTDTYEGTASWYAHKRYPAGAATNLFPIGTKLKVTNRANDKSTIVTVTSTWTNTDEKRIIDLVSTAFKKIASLSSGLIPIRIERL